MGKGNFLPGQYESVYNFNISHLSKLYFNEIENDDDENYENYDTAVMFFINDLKEKIKNNATLYNHFAVLDNDKWLSRFRDDFLVIAESDFYKIVIQDDGIYLNVALLIDDNAYNYNLSESDIENKLKQQHPEIDKALRKMLLSFGIDLYKPTGAWTSGKVSDNND